MFGSLIKVGYKFELDFAHLTRGMFSVGKNFGVHDCVLSEEILQEWMCEGCA